MHTLARPSSSVFFVVSVLVTSSLGACSKKEEAAAAESTPVSGDLRASWAQAEENLPECTEAAEGDLAYVREAKQAYLCQSKKWASFESYTSGAFVVLSTALSAGDTCRYGGVKYESGIDLDADDKLDAAEVKSRINVCEAGIDAIAKTTFKAALPSIAFTVPHYTNVACGGEYQFTNVKPVGFVSASDTVVQEISSFPATQSIDCDGDAGNGAETLTLSGVTLSFPKKTLDADAIWERGFSGELGNEDEFDSVEASAYDFTSMGLGATAVAPFNFFKVDLSAVGARTALVASSIDPTVATGTSLSVGEQLFGVGHGVISNGYSTKGFRIRKSSVTGNESCLTFTRNEGYSEQSGTTRCTGTFFVPAASVFTFLDLPAPSSGGYLFNGIWFDRSGKVAGTTSARNLSSYDDQHPALTPARDLLRAIAATRSWTNF